MRVPDVPYARLVVCDALVTLLESAANYARTEISGLIVGPAAADGLTGDEISALQETLCTADRLVVQLRELEARIRIGASDGG